MTFARDDDAGTRPLRAAGAPAPDAPFAEPWQAQAFALVAHLHERGVFGWDEWTAALARELEGQDPAAGGADYHERWLAALESVLAARDLVDADALEATVAAWHRAARATPHGMPIELANDPGTRG